MPEPLGRPTIGPPQPSANPFPKVVYSGVVSAFGNNIYGIRRASFVAQAETTDQAIISPNGTCASGLATPTSFVLSFGTQQATDSYGRTIAGGPAEPDPGNIFTQNVGPSATSVIFGFKTTKGVGARKLPWLSGLTAKRGVKFLKYGDPGYDFTDDAGVTWISPGTPDPIVRIPQVQINPAVVGGVDLSSITLTAGDDGEGAQVLIDGTTITRDPTTGVLSAPDSNDAAGFLAQYDFHAGAFQTDDGSTTPDPFFVPWTRTVFAKGGFVWDGAHPTRMTVPADGDGIYFITGQLFADAGSLSTLDPASEIEIDAYVNGAYPGPPFGTALPLQITGGVGDIQSSGTTFPFTGWLQLHAGDYVEIRLFASSSVGYFASWNPDYSWCTIVQMGGGSATSIGAWKGAWDVGTAYVEGNTVSDGGNIYVCILANTGQATSDTTYWTPLAARGATGATGAAGRNGIDGTNGIDGSDGAPGVGVPVGGTTGQILAKIDATDYNTEWITDTDSGGGTVTSVDMTVPSALLAVSGNPVTTSGTLALSLPTRAANLIFAGPSSGGAAAPAFRSLVAADVPDLSATYALAGTAGVGELLVADGVTSPPVALYTEDGTDFLYQG